ncbi:HAF repeat-containing protein [Variovorax sp. DAIF25]|uniref:HAF repeat-containing protein n=1 Tax=Variovorax sp. DAIF25 TaxID=3080983 RepID=UPI003D6C2BCD
MSVRANSSASFADLVLSALPRLLMAASPLLVGSLAQAGPMQDIGISSGPQCAGTSVNNSGHVVGACAEADGMASGFVALAPGGAVDLGHLMGGRSCSASAVTNSGRIIGSCLNGNSLSTAVVWNSATPQVTQTLDPLPLVLLPPSPAGVRTRATAFSQSGVVAGVSVNANNTALPVVWYPENGTANALPEGLLGLGATNCAPADVDDYAANPARPDIVGNCPGSNGRPQAVFWSANGLLGGYTSAALPLPAGATFCAASTLNSGKILGYCDFGAQGGRTALWPNKTTAPALLSTNPARNSGIDLNASGGVIGQYQNSTGESIPFYWDTANNIRTDIPSLSGGFKINVTDIGDNGMVVGTSELIDGSRHAISWTPSTSTVDLGTLPGGENSGARVLSQSGCYLTGSSEVGAGHATHAFVQNLCAP